MRKLLPAALAVAVCLLAAVLLKLTLEVYSSATRQEHSSADVIVILGAAEYRGKPSPVLKARLDHGYDLFHRKLAPRILTTGGAGGDPVFTEGEVGRDYLIRLGVPAEAIIVEPEASSTAESAAAVAEIMRRMNLASCLVVTDGYHIFRVKKMLEGHGVRVFGSPRPSQTPADARFWWLCTRQAFAYLLWSVGIRV